ncbi:MAG: ATP-binding protein [Providencia rettgeri]|nr:ATP-binding protein [Providencia rettgeri]
MLMDKVKITKQYQRSVRIDSDLGRLDSLDGYICNKSSQSVFNNLCSQIINSQQRAFTLTGPYGSGKSSLAITFLSALLPNQVIRDKAYARLDNGVLTLFKQAFPINKGWNILPITGNKSDIVQEISNRLRVSISPKEKKDTKFSSSELIAYLKELSNSPLYDGLILVIDEMGKFLEYSAQDKNDIHFYQDLAEASSRSDGKLIVIGILHQSFRQYSSKLGSEIQNEWAKVQGRYIDIPMVSSSDETIELLSKAITISDDLKNRVNLNAAKIVAEEVRKRRPSISVQLENSLTKCWPLHPTMAAILGPASRRHFGQNERSIFGFLSSPEPYAFHDFLKSAVIDDVLTYTPEHYWNFLRTNLEPAILSSPDSHRWAQSVEAVERVEASSDKLKISLIKNIAVLDFFRNSTGLPASNQVIKSIYPNSITNNLDRLLHELKKSNVIVYRKHLESWSVFEGSDFDIDQEIKNELINIPSLNFELLSNSASIRPIVAKKHYYQTGSLRWMDMSLCSFGVFKENLKSINPINSDRFGEFFIIFPEFGMTNSQLKKELKKIRENIPENIIPGVPLKTDKIVDNGYELMALYEILGNNHEIISDSVARREIYARITALKNIIEESLREALRYSEWLIDNSWIKIENYSSIASKLADKIFYDSPCIKSELINRNIISPNAVKARKDLLYKMLYAENEENLGLSGWPAERGLHETLLVIPRIHKSLNGTFGLTIPTYNDDVAILSPLFKFTDKLFIEENKLISVKELFSLWEKPPFGVKKGIHPILFLVYILANKDKMALYKDNYFISKITDTEIDELLQDSSRFHVKKVVVSENRHDFLSKISNVLIQLGIFTTSTEPLEIARALVGMIYALPEWSKRTSTLSEDSKKMRDLLLRASDPHKLLFVDLPFTFLSVEEDDISTKIENAIKEIINSYSNLLKGIRKKMFIELDVGHNDYTEIKNRANTVLGISGDFRFDAFSTRLKDLNETNESIESILSLAANKPPRLWSDNDIDIALLEIASWSKKFKRIEVLSSIKNRKPTREAFAFIFDDHENGTVQAEYDIKSSDIETIGIISKKILDEVYDKNLDKNILLAALAKVSMTIVNSKDE